MAQRSKYADISDIDDAPEFYETADIPADSPVDETSASYDSDEDEEEDAGQTISRQHTQTEEARKHFQLTAVDARGADFSDRIRRKRRSYKTSHKQVRRKDSSKIGDFSDEEDETLARKLARLQREVREVEEEYERRRKEKEEQEDESEEEEDSDDDEEDEEDIINRIQRMSESLDKVYLQSRRGGPTGAEAQLARSVRRFSKASGSLLATTTNGTADTEIDQSFLQGPVTPSAAQAQQRHALAKAADFDVRLSALEATLGLNALNMPDLADESQKPVLLKLEALDTQIAALATPNSTVLESAGRKLAELTQEAERLDTLRSKAAQPPSNRPSKPSTPALNGPSDAPIDAESLAKINELYKALPSIESLAPTVPLLVERLRTLRLIHTSAGSAHSTLDDIERKQMEQAAEIKKWRDTLQQVEKGLEKGDESIKKNIGSMGTKVRLLEERLEKLG